GRIVRDLGMTYLHHPVKSDAMGPDLVDRFRERLQDLPRPIYAHCASGKRSGAFVMMHLAVEQGITGQQTVEKAASMGFECDTPELEKFVTSYVDQRRQGG
ncbi:MAG: sulfur transferase domain-containing protein, partial [Geminicoccaceae bacterium]|nr:sulfur transferase domain-containing protein [Geminicoccaceae bacterium]